MSDYMKQLLHVLNMGFCRVSILKKKFLSKKIILLAKVRERKSGLKNKNQMLGVIKMNKD
jgi:hypothetical protein